MASELNSESKPTKVGMPWNRRIRPTLVRWCERTEASSYSVPVRFISFLALQYRLSIT